MTLQNMTLSAANNNDSDVTSGIYIIRCITTDFIYDSREMRLELNISSNIAFNFILAIVTTLLNGLTTYIMLIHTKYQTPSYFLLLNNAILDGLFPLTLIPWNFILMEIMDENTSCAFIDTSLYIGYVLGSCSVLLANLMALDRYLAIFRPFFYHEKILVNYKSYGPCIIGGSIFSTVFTGVSLLTPNFSLYYGYATLILSTAIMFGLYVIIRTHLLVKEIGEKTYPSIKHKEREERRRKHEDYMNKLTMALIVVLLATYAPFAAYSMIRLVAYRTLTTNSYAAVVWVYTFIYSKSIANPLLFCISMSTLRRDIRRLFRKKNNAVHGMENSRTNVYAETNRTNRTINCGRSGAAARPPSLDNQTTTKPSSDEATVNS